MERTYNIDGYVFVKVKEDSAGNCYFDIIHPDGRKLDYAHFFASEADIISWVRSR